MASVGTEEYEKGVSAAAAAPPPERKEPLKTAEVVLRFLVFASSLVAVLVMVTGNQTEVVARIPIPPFTVSRTAKFKHSPAFIYFVAAHSVAGFFGIVSTLLSFYGLKKPAFSQKASSHFVIIDVLLLGIVASATGAGSAVAYVGLKGNSHVQWGKICGLYDSFCRHIGASMAVSLFGSVVLTLLVLLSLYSLSKKIPK
ncbi:CASP-like protein 1 [Andrographis paniculata]|uniref:CASP-like protein 1 n=1 Tax=Andrographis paniculata TaxID=175694 RepID=UPI0021E7C203|nr:CASP-like protein 1 [Andrographis paniculata]